MKIKKHNSKGFTLIELMIATLIFSLVLVVILSAFVQISRLFYKGVNLTRTQEDSRQIVQDISDDIKFAQNISTNLAASYNTPGPGYFCIGLHRYKYRLGYQLGSSAVNDFGIIRDTVSVGSGCTSGAAGTDQIELLDNGMQLNKLNVTCNGGRCLVNVHVVFYGGAPDLFASTYPGYSSNKWQAPDAQCTGNLEDTQYCATADYNSTVLQRT